MRTLVLVGLIMIGPITSAQNGPGGVGSTANNVLWLSGDKGVGTIAAGVNTWNDRSGNANHAASSAPTTRPTLVGAALNGYPILSFDAVDDDLLVPDANSLDLTQWDVFFVGADNAPKNNNAWLAKGTSTQPNYALWSTATDALQLPIYDIIGLLSTPTTPANATGSAFNVIQYNNTVFLGIFPSRTVYKNGSSIYSDLNLLQLPVTNSAPLALGNVLGSVGWNLDGRLAEVIMYNAPVNGAQRIIISNYLAAKYGLTLTSNDIYIQDNPLNGNYDHDVAGIGRTTSATSQQTDSRGSGVVRINNPTGLGNNEFLLWGHDNGVLGAWGSSDYPVGLQGRWFRVWRVNEVSPTGTAVDVGNVDITFDLANQGTVTASDLRLLVDANNSQVFADDVPIGGATWLGGTLYRFAGVNALQNGRRFTLGTINSAQTPLPLQLLYFDATAENNSSVRLDWATATERDNDHFIVQRGVADSGWEDVVQVPGAGNSTSLITYTANDRAPLAGLSYYRLRQVDHDGATTLSDMVAVWIDRAANDLLIYPDPAQDVVNVVFGTGNGKGELRLVNDLGQSFNTPMNVVDGRAAIDVSHMPTGGYVVMVVTDRLVLKKRLVIAR